MANTSRNTVIWPIACAMLGFAALIFLMRQAPMGHTELVKLSSGYRVTAKFDNVGDLKIGSPLSIAGVRIGSVDLIRYDPGTAKAVITLRVTSTTMQVPIDSVASVRSLSPVGGKQVIISPGGSGEFLADGGEITQTTSVVALETIIQKSMKAAADHLAKPKSST